MFDFNTRLRALQRQKQSVLCVGLDPDPARLPAHLLDGRSLPDAVLAFNRAVIAATHASACAFKLNFAFFEALGREGWRVLEETLAALPENVLTVADAKRGDIGNSARFYARSVFDDLGFDSVTVSPYMGADSVLPFLDYAGKAVFVLGRTSNPGGDDLQPLMADGLPLYLHVARRVRRWHDQSVGTAGLVAGATQPEAIRHLRTTCPTLPFLVPGVGAQGGDARAVLAAAQTAEGPVLINSSRQILYAASGEDFAEAAGRAAETLRAELHALGTPA